MKQINVKKITTLTLIGTTLLSSVCCLNQAEVFAIETNNTRIIDVYTKVGNQDFIPCKYSNSFVKNKFDELIERTNRLEKDYSPEEALSILKDTQKVMKDITKKDYEVNYETKHDENNYFINEGYAYKCYTHEWIMKNVTHYMLLNSINDTNNIKELVKELYNAGILELQGGAKETSILLILSNLQKIKDFSNDELDKYFDYITQELQKTSSDFDNNGIIPSDRDINDDYEKYLIDIEKEAEYEKKLREEQKKELQESENTKKEYDTTNTTDTNPIGKTDFNSENYFPSNGVSNSKIDSSYKGTNFSDYHNSMSTISSTSTYYSNQNAGEYSIYYTTNKNSDTPNWIDARLTLSDKDKVDFINLISVLKTLTKNEKNSYIFEDSDMIMFIGDGQNIVINKQEYLTSNEINNLFNDFENIGLKVLLKSDEAISEKDSLEYRVQNGEVNKISIDDKDIILTEKPIITKGILQLPIKQTAETLGYSYSQNGNKITLTYKKTINVPVDTIDEVDNIENNKEVDNTNKIETSKETIETTTIVFTIGSTTYTVNGSRGSFKSPVTKNNGVIYAEFDKIAYIVGYNYSYNTQANVIEFTK